MFKKIYDALWVDEVRIVPEKTIIREAHRIDENTWADEIACYSVKVIKTGRKLFRPRIVLKKMWRKLLRKKPTLKGV